VPLRGCGREIGAEDTGGPKAEAGRDREIGAERSDLEEDPAEAGPTGKSVRGAAIWKRTLPRPAPTGKLVGDSDL